MNSVALILPDFLVIVLGYLIRDRLGLTRAFWAGAEKLVFYVLFPPLLFLSIVNAKAGVGDSARFLCVAVGAMLMAVVAAWCVRYVVRADDWTHGSVFHCGFRFNTYIGFAVCLKLFGQEGFALMALLIAVWVPVSNTIAVSVLSWAVARHENAAGQKVVGNTVRAVVKNPLIIATVAGLVFKIAGIGMPALAGAFFKDLGSASLAMGLLCIGAGLRFSDFREHAALIAACSVERLIVVPAIALIFALTAGLTGAAAGALMIFAALPTAQSCYVMTAAMRGNAPVVADVTSAQTLLAMLTMPLWILAFPLFFG